jgi:integrase
MSLPKGITQIKWKNKGGGKAQVRYRVRVSRKDLKVDEVFDSLAEATEYAKTTYSKAGRELIQTKQQEELVQETLKILLSTTKFGDYVDKYIKTYIDKGEKDLHPSKKRSIQINVNRIQVCIKTLVPYAPKNIKDIPGFFELNNSLHKHFKDGGSQVGLRALGEFDITEIDGAVATDYIRERLKTVQKSTVRREIGQLQTIFNKLPFIAPATAKLITSNPFEQADKALLKGHNKKRKRRIATTEEDKLFKHLAGMRNPAMLQIVALALATGMRRSEVLFLEWDYIKKGYILLPEDATKSQEERTVWISKDAQAILDTIKRVERQKRLFMYTIDGFKTNFYRAVKACGIEDLRFHDLRREHITRMVLALTDPSAIVISQMVGMRSAAHVQSQYIDPAVQDAKHGITDTSSLMSSVGHKKLGMLNHYTNIVDTNSGR